MTFTGVNIYNMTCGVTGTAKCGLITINATLTGNLYGVGISGETIQTGTVAVLDGTGTVAAAGCTAPFSALNAKTATFTNLVLTY